MNKILPQSPKNSKPIYLLRHGETSMDLVNKAQGTRPFPITVDSRKDVKKAAEELKNEPFDVIVTSDLLRAFQTAKIVSKASGKPIGIIDERLRPWDYGDNVGKDEDFIFQQQNDVYLPEPDLCMPGGGESFNEYRDRYLDALEGVLAQYTGQTVLIISHSVNERLTRAWDKAGRDRRNFDMKEFKTKCIGAAEWECFGVAKGKSVLPLT